MTGPGPLLGLVYLGVGFGVAVLLHRRGHEAGVVLGSLVAWPLLLPLLGGEPSTASLGCGPHAVRIDRALNALLDTLADPAAAALGFDGDLAGLREALHGVDARLALVDRLLGEESDAPSVGALRSARAQAVQDIDEVLAEVTELRLQVGLMTLAGDGAALRARLHELSLRASAFDELQALEPR